MDADLFPKQYAHIKQVGHGAFGAVYLARDTETDDDVVIKRIPIFDLSKPERQKAHHEVEVLRKLSHPHIVNFQDSFTYSGCLNIVMEYCPDGDLQQVPLQRQGRWLAWCVGRMTSCRWPLWLVLVAFRRMQCWCTAMPVICLACWLYCATWIWCGIEGASRALRAVRRTVRRQPGARTNDGNTKRCFKLGSGH